MHWTNAGCSALTKSGMQTCWKAILRRWKDFPGGQRFQCRRRWLDPWPGEQDPTFLGLPVPPAPTPKDQESCRLASLASLLDSEDLLGAGTVFLDWLPLLAGLEWNIMRTLKHFHWRRHDECILSRKLRDRKDRQGTARGKIAQQQFLRWSRRIFLVRPNK